MKSHVRMVEWLLVHDYHNIGTIVVVFKNIQKNGLTNAINASIK